MMQITAISIDTGSRSTHSVSKRARKGDIILSIVATHGPITRREIMTISGYPWSTIYDVLYRLEIKGKVSRFSQPIKRARPWVFWTAN